MTGLGHWAETIDFSEVLDCCFSSRTAADGSRADGWTYGVIIGWLGVIRIFIGVDWGGMPDVAHETLHQAGGLASLAFKGIEGFSWLSAWLEGAACGNCLGDSIGELREVWLVIPS